MRKVRLLSIVLCLVLLFATASLTGCKDDVQLKLTTGLSEGELFRIEKKSCTQAEARLFLMNQKNRYEMAYGDRIWDAMVGKETFSQQMTDQLEAFLYQWKGMVLMAESRDISLSEDEKNRAAEAAKEYMAGLSTEAAAYLNMTEEQLTRLYREYRMAERLVAQVTAVVADEISDDEARVIQVQQIVLPLTATLEDGTTAPLSAKEQADAWTAAREAADRAAAGDAFATLQELYSAESVGSICVSRHDVEDAWETAVFALGNGEVSDIIETEEALYVVRCIKNLLPEETVENKDVILARKKAEVFYQEYNAFVAKLVVQSDDQRWQELSFGKKVPVGQVDFYEIYDKYF